jgi:hypothetical protein
VSSSVSPINELLEQAGLPDARFTHDLEGRRPSAGQLREGVFEKSELSDTSDEWSGGRGHDSSLQFRVGHPPGRGQATEDQGATPMSRPPNGVRVGYVALFLIHHRHEPHECGAVFASFKGKSTPLRHGTALASCGDGGHAIWWAVEARNEAAALDQLPHYVLERASATRVTSVDIP